MRAAMGQEGPSDRSAMVTAATVATAVVAALIAVVYLLHLRPWSFLCDDAFISFRYAQNLGEHGALVYNLAPLEHVEGYTNFLWVLVLALGVVVGLAPEQLAPVLTAAAGLLSLWLLARIGAALRRGIGRDDPSRQAILAAPELPDLLAPALLVLLPEFVVWGSSGLETSAALALGLAAIWTWLAGRIELAALFAGLAGLTRPDALAWIAGFGLGWLAVVAAARLRGDGLQLAAIPWRRLAVALAIFVALIGGQLLFRRAYYGQWLPNTWAVKHHGALLRDSWGVGYLRFWFDRLQLLWLAPMLVLLRPRHLTLALPIAVVVVYAWSVGGDFMAYGRFLLPATALLALLLGLLLGESVDLLRARKPKLALAIGAGVALLLLVGCARRIPQRLTEDHEHAHLHIAYDQRGRPAPDTPGFEGVQAMDRFAAVRLAAGVELAQVVPADTWISVGAAGALPYASRLPAYDAYGLVDPGVLTAAEPTVGMRARPGHQLQASLAYMHGRDPDLMCHIGWEAPVAPTRRDARRRAGAGWGWACVETGPIPDRRAAGGTLEGRYYCCLRPIDRLTELDPEARR